MKEFPKRKTMRLSTFDYNTPSAYFMTICMHQRKRLLSEIKETSEGVKPELSRYGEIAYKQICKMNELYEDMQVDKFVIMPNHIHFVLFVWPNGPSRTPVPTTPQNTAVSKYVSTFKRFTNKEIGLNIWQSRSYDHVIRSKEDYIGVCKYIKENPLYWQEDELYEKDN